MLYPTLARDLTNGNFTIQNKLNDKIKIISKVASCYWYLCRKSALAEAEKKLLEITATAEKRKKLLDEMATEKFELNQELTQVKEKISAEAEGKLKSQKSEADQNILQLKKELKEQIAQRKQGEMRILDANRRIDELMSEVKKVDWKSRASYFNPF